MSQNSLLGKSPLVFPHKQTVFFWEHPDIVTLTRGHPARICVYSAYSGKCIGERGVFIRHHPPPLALHAVCRVPTVSEELIGGTGTPPAGTRWGGCIHLQFLRWKGTAVHAQPRRLSLFAHIISTLANTAQWLVSPQHCAEAQTFLTFYAGLHGPVHFLIVLP